MSRGWKIVVAALATILAVFALYRWTSEEEATPSARVRVSPSPRIAAAGRAPTDRPTSQPARQSPSTAAVPSAGSSPAPPTPGVFDFAKLGPSGATPQSSEAERFATNDRFTQDDLQHPERYFDVAEHMPELQRPEERRDTLDFFLAYRDKLKRDLDDATSPRQREDVLAVLERYESAIQRLRGLIEAEGAE